MTIIYYIFHGALDVKYAPYRNDLSAHTVVKCFSVELISFAFAAVSLPLCGYRTGAGVSLLNHLSAVIA